MENNNRDEIRKSIHIINRNKRRIKYLKEELREIDMDEQYKPICEKYEECIILLKAINGEEDREIKRRQLKIWRK